MESRCDATNGRKESARPRSWRSKIPLEAILVKACLPALEASFPQFNASVVDGGVELHSHYNIGLAADTDTGLVVPVLKDADRL